MAENKNPMKRRLAAAFALLRKSSMSEPFTGRLFKSTESPNPAAAPVANM